MRALRRKSNSRDKAKAASADHDMASSRIDSSAEVQHGASMDTPSTMPAAADAGSKTGTAAAAPSSRKRANNADAASIDCAYPPSTRDNERQRQGDSSRGSSNNKRTSLLASAPTPPSTTKKNEATSAAAAAGISLRRLVTPPIVARAMRDTPSTLPQGIGRDGDASASVHGNKEAAIKDPSQLEYLGNASISVDEPRPTRTLLTPASKAKEANPSAEKNDENGLEGRRGSQQQGDEGAGIFSWTDAQLAQHYIFEKEIGFGNWGSVWLATPRKSKNDSCFVIQPVAIKLVHRQGTPASNARVKAIWNETKILRSCGKPTHENLVHFKEFVITPSYALVVMDYYRQPMNVALPISMYAGPDGYFHQLLDSINWLHERNVTHCDIKVANLLVDTRKDKLKGKPILVDFGFATLHDNKTKFMSNQSWGTPEYLSPERNRGDLHDERLSDIWALGVTFFEIATGRTPFEHEDEQFLTKEQLDVYYRRTLDSDWVGSWNVPDSLENLCRQMLSPDVKKRIYCRAALEHAFFRHDIIHDDIGDIDESLMQELRSGEAGLVETYSSGQPIISPRCASEHKEGGATEVRETNSLVPGESSMQAAASPSPQNNGFAAPTVPSKGFNKNESMTEDADLTRSEVSYESEGGTDAKQANNSAFSKLKAPFKRNKKRAYPPSAFSAAAKQQRGSSSSGRFNIARRSSDGAISVLREFVERKRKSHSTQERRFSIQQQQASHDTLLQTEKLQSDLQKMQAPAVPQEEHETVKKGHEQTKAVYTENAISDGEVYEVMPDHSFHMAPNVEVKHADLIHFQSTSATCSTSLKRVSPKRKPLPEVNLKSEVNYAAEGNPAGQPLGQQAPEPPPKAGPHDHGTSDSAEAGHVLSQDSHMLPNSHNNLDVHDLTAEELAARLAQMSILTKNLVRMVQETQMALHKLQQRSQKRDATRDATQRTKGELQQPGLSMPIDHRNNEEHYRDQASVCSTVQTSEVLAMPAKETTLRIADEAPKAELGVSSAVLASQAILQTSALDRLRLGHGTRPTTKPFDAPISSYEGMARPYRATELSATPHRNSTASSTNCGCDYQGGEALTQVRGNLDRNRMVPPKADSNSAAGPQYQMTKDVQVIGSPTVKTPGRESSMDRYIRAPSFDALALRRETHQGDVTWPQSARAEMSISDAQGVMSSRTYQSPGATAAKSPLSPSSVDEIKGKRKMTLSRVKSFHLRRSSSIKSNGSGRPDCSSPRLTQARRNTLVEVQWDQEASSPRRLYNGIVYSPTRATPSSPASKRRQSESTMLDAGYNRVFVNSSGGIRNDEAIPTSAIIMSQGNRKRGSIGRPPTSPPVLIAKVGAAAVGESPAMTMTSVNTHSTSGGAGLWRALANKVHSRR